MDSIFDYFSHERERRTWGKLNREDQLAQLPTLCDENFNHEYQIICEEIRDDGYSLGANANKIFWDKDVSLEEIKADWQQFMEHVEALQAFYSELLRRFLEKRRGQ